MDSNSRPWGMPPVLSSDFRPQLRDTESLEAIIHHGDEISFGDASIWQRTMQLQLLLHHSHSDHDPSAYCCSVPHSFWYPQMPCLVLAEGSLSSSSSSTPGKGWCCTHFIPGITANTISSIWCKGWQKNCVTTTINIFFQTFFFTSNHVRIEWKHFLSTYLDVKWCKMMQNAKCYLKHTPEPQKKSTSDKERLPNWRRCWRSTFESPKM